MWLINASDFSLRDIHEAGDRYSYAILSHTWDESDDNNWHGEVTFQDMRDLAHARKKSGWRKIKQTCRLAREKGLQWAWVDTCCIDKSSSADLSEAINSMFRWYQEAATCIVYLGDLHQCSRANDTTASARQLERLSACRWFTRGWTLQELIAPTEVEFYNAGWNYLGTKTSLELLISKITGVDVAVLRDCEERFEIPVAQRMRWASCRTTKRIEDIAYSLLGIFDINMPLIYGEGKKAFVRLQNAIIQQTDDLSIFAWSIENTINLQDCAPQKYYGLFAESPHYFKSFSNLQIFYGSGLSDSCSFTNVNQGLRFEAFLMPDRVAGDYILQLFFQSNVDASNGEYIVVKIRLVKTATGYVRHGSGENCARKSESNVLWSSVTLRETFVVPKTLDPRQSLKLENQLQNALKIHMKDASYHVGALNACLGPLKPGPSSGSVWIRPQTWDTAKTTFITGNHPEFTGLLTLGGHPIHTLPGGWLQNIRIICGLRWRQNIPSSRSQPQLTIEPWAFFIHDEHERFEAVSGGSRTASIRLFDEFRVLRREQETYSSIVSRLREHARLFYTDFRDLSTKIRVIPPFEDATPSITNGHQIRLPGCVIELSLQPERTEEDGIVTHVITLLVEEVED